MQSLIGHGDLSIMVTWRSTAQEEAAAAAAAGGVHSDTTTYSVCHLLHSFAAPRDLLNQQENKKLNALNNK
jgi:hypothetical protein